MAETREIINKELEEALLTGDFERVWEEADWIFKADKQDAQYFFLLGQRSQLLKENAWLKQRA